MRLCQLIFAFSVSFWACLLPAHANGQTMDRSEITAALSEYEGMKEAFIKYGVSINLIHHPQGSEDVLVVIDLPVCDLPRYYTDQYSPVLGQSAIDLAYVMASLNNTFRSGPLHDKTEELQAAFQLGEKRFLRSLTANQFEDPVAQFSEESSFDETVEFRAFAGVVNATLRQYGFYVDITVACGGSSFGVFELLVEGKPEQTMLMTKWNALLCEAQNIDPFNQNLCRGWRNVGTPTLESLVEYLYVVKWSKGRQIRGSFDFENRNDGEYQVTLNRRGAAFSLKPKEREWWKIYESF